MKRVLMLVLMLAIVGFVGLAWADEIHGWYAHDEDDGSSTLVPKGIPGEVTHGGAVKYYHQGKTELTPLKWETVACWYSIELKKNQRVEISFDGLTKTNTDAPFYVHVLSSPFDQSAYYAEYSKLAGVAKWTATGGNGFNFRISAGEASGGSRTYTLSNGFTFKSTQDVVYICVSTPGGLNEQHTIGFTITAKFEETEEGAPTCVEAFDAATDNVQISWAEVTGATSYNLYRSTTPDRPKSAIQTNVTSPFLDRTTEPGIKYYYWVEAIHSSGSAFSLCDMGYRMASLSLSPATRSHAASSCQGSFSVTANAAWGATANKDWIKLKTDSGNGNGSLTYMIDENTDTSLRTGFITVTAGSDCPTAKSVSILQDGAEFNLSYSIKYDLDGGSYGLKHPTKVASDAVVQVSAPTRDGYVFAGWTVTNGLSKTATWGTSAIGASSPSAAKRITSSSTVCYNGETGSVWFVHLAVELGSATLRANWTAGSGSVTHKVTFDLGSHGVRTGGGLTMQAVADGAAAIAPLVTAKEGYEFEGWDQAFSLVKGDLIVKARYSLTKYAITYVGLKDAINPSSNPTEYTIESPTITFTALPDVGDYKFAGWNPSSIAIGSIGDKKVTANWSVEGASAFVIVDGVLTKYLGKSADVIIPSGVTSIGDEVFYCRTKLESVVIPDGVKSIGEAAFYFCENLSEVVIPPSVTDIGVGAFCFCSGLSSFEIPLGVTSIGRMAFYACKGLTSVKIPKGVVSIGERVFDECAVLEEIRVDHGDANRVKKLLFDSGLDVSKIRFVEPEVVPDVKVGEWSYEYVRAKAFADEYDLPLVVFWTNPGCSVCKKMTAAFETQKFLSWQSNRDYVFVYSEGSEIVRELVRNDSGEFPYVAVQWTSKDIDVRFSGKDGKMPVKDGDLVDQFTQSVDTSFLLVSPERPVIEGDEDAMVMGDAERGFVIKPSEGKTTLEVTIPQSVNAAKVTVEVSAAVSRVKLNGAKMKIVSGGADITEFLNVPVADESGVVDLEKATVKEEIVKETMDVEKGAEIELNTANPSLTTSNTRIGLFYTFSEGRTLGGMERSASKTGDGKPWSPEIKVKGGNSAFYSIGVGKGK